MNCIFSFFRKEEYPFRDLFTKEQWAQILQDLEKVDFTKTQATVHYMLCSVNEQPSSEVERRMKEISRILRSHDANIMTDLPPIRLATFGMPREQDPDRSAKLTAAVQDIMKALPNDAKLIYGSPTALYGMLDCSSIEQFGVILPGMEERLKRLLDLKYGETLRLD